jgi:hypothetical protein
MTKWHCVVHMTSPIFGVETTFFFIETKRQFVSSKGFSDLEKNAVMCSQRAMLPDNSPMQILLAVWDTFFEFELPGSGVTACY